MPDGEEVGELLRSNPSKSMKSMAYKTVDTFAGIMGRKLWLRNGKIPRTNGFLIEVPFDHPRMYQLVEHEISHPLFGSDPTAKILFIEDYSKKVSAVALKRGVVVDERMLRRALDMIVGILEDERVISLWGLLYMGSEKVLRWMARKDTKKHVQHAHQDLITLFCVIAGGHDPGEGELSRFVPYFVEALRKVHLRDFTATLITSKWLVTQLVSEVIRQNQGLPPPPEPPPEAAEPPEPPPEAPEPPLMPWEAPEGPEEPSEGPVGGHGRAAWRPPTTKAGESDRTEALQQLVERLGQGPRDLRDRYDDFVESKYKNRWDESRARQKANQAIRAQVKNADELEKKLEESTASMQRIVDKVRSNTRGAVDHDDWIRREALAKVVFTDVGPSDITRAAPEMSYEDLATVRRLRATFIRIMGRRSTRLEEAGASLDIPAYIERKLTGSASPVFRAHSSGRGFKALILIDRSSSMKGARTHQAERACRMISKALQFPFVDSRVWGFQSMNGEVDIIRFEPGMESFSTLKSTVGGRTPLHTAIRIAVKYLEAGSEAKQLFVVTDGHPTHSGQKGSFSTRTLMAYVRAEVQRARSRGVGVTGVMIGDERNGYVRSEVQPKDMSFMFGAPKHWRLVSGRKLGNDLVQLVSRSFLDYLRTG